MDIQVYSDTVCPWCFVGKRRLQQALDQRPALEAAVVWRPFQLNPDMPSGGMERDEYIRAKFGDGGYGSMGDALRAAGHSVGIEFDFDRASRIPNTVDSHRLLAMAESVHRQPELSEVLFRQYFVDGLDIGDLKVLVTAAAEAGLDQSAVESLLAGEQGRAEIRQSDHTARTMGISGVPTFVFDGRYAIVGAQEPDVFLQLLDLMEAEGSEAKMASTGAA